MNLEIFCLRERPDLVPLIFSNHMDAIWPKFMQHDATAKLYFGQSVFNNYLDYAFAGLVDGEVVGRAFSVPFALGIEGRTELPDGGWDQVIRWAHEDGIVGRAPTTMSALEIAFVPKARGRGNSLAMLDALKACARRKGFAEMFAPVRPNRKHLQPRLAMRDYIELKRSDGLPLDAWLRTHVRIGGSIVKIASCSMTIVGTIAEWSQWTGRTFKHSGEVEVEGALAPVLVSIEQDYAVYVEPNVWVRHPL
jgi:GNAT superfamily N-acetyltransferase